MAAEIGESVALVTGRKAGTTTRVHYHLDGDNNEVGTLTGQVANALVEAEGCTDPSVFVFGEGVAPNPIGSEEEGMDDPNDPISTAMVDSQEQEDGTVQYHYTVGFLLAGTYNVAYTCDDGATFEPAGGQEAIVTVGGTTISNIEEPAE